MNREDSEQKDGFVHENGVTYFSKRTERRILFVLTMAMMLWGVVECTRGFF
ncbi:hypothetical protein [Pseudodesulfovibrio karagichevae]|uniref:Uncharacterized protein n=1 Tax=Pseudodesulfovibrio karagichevae TaxID=3239305 RepID=A0ABV4K721_9BACT